nr:polymorphic toxin-type HINT domain-containing protein [Leptospira meyeri]
MQVGDVVLSKSDETGEVSYRKVVNTFIRQTEAIYTVSFTDGTVLETTWNHPFRVKKQGHALEKFSIENTDWIQAKDLHPGDVALGADGQELVITDITIDERVETVYNFEVEGYHTYFVGEVGVWVHNAEYITDVRVFAPFKEFGPLSDLPVQDIYHGDNLGFSEAENASSRIHDKISIDTNTGKVSGIPYSEPTILDYGFGKIQETANDKLNYNSSRKLPDGTIVIERNFSGGNPLGTPFDSISNKQFGRGASPEIDVNYKMTIKDENNIVKIGLKVKGDAFPAAEAVIFDANKKTSVIISTFGVSRLANPLINLPGANNREMMDANIIINKDKKGNFVSVEHNGKTITVDDWNNAQKGNCTRKPFYGTCP